MRLSVLASIVRIVVPIVVSIAVPLLGACASAAPEATGAPQATETAAPEIPVRVRWNVISDAGGRLLVDAVVVRRAPLRFPVSVRVRVPAGLTWVSGPTRFEVPADGQTGESMTRLEFSYRGAPPAGDLELVGDAGDPGAGVGIHAADAYRFGRTVDVKKPAPSGPDVKIGDKNLGPAVPIGK